MLVSDMMNKNVITLKPTDTIQTALKLIQKHKIRHLPVINEERRCIGIVSDRDIRSAIPSSLSKEIDSLEIFNQTVDSIMIQNIITVHPLDFFEEAAVIFDSNRIGCLPVESENRLVGIITQTDIIRTFIKLTGTDQPGSQIEVRLPNETGKLATLTTLISEQNVNILSVLIYPDKEDSNYRIVVIRIRTINPTPILESLRKNGIEVLFPKLKELPL